MNKIINFAFKVSIILIALLISFLCIMERNNKKPKKIVFETPIPLDTSAKYDLDLNPEIDKVYISSGYFNDWISNDSAFELKKVIKKDNTCYWEIYIPFDEGETEYKFVVYLTGRESPIWIHDKKAVRQVADNYDGVNSMMVIRSYKSVIYVLSIVFLLQIFVLVVIWLYNKLLPRGIKKAALIIGVFVLISSNIFFISIQNITFNENLKRDFLSYINNITNEIGTPDNIDEISTKMKIYKTINRFVWFDIPRINKHFFENEFLYSEFMLLDKDFNIIISAGRGAEKTRERSIIERDGVAGLRDFLSHKILPIHKSKLEKVEITKLNYRNSAMIDKYFNVLRYNQSGLWGNTYLFTYPIINKNGISGHIGIYARTRLLNPGLINFLIFNFILIAIVSLLVYLILQLKPVDINKHTAVPKEENSNASRINEERITEYQITAREKQIIEMILLGRSNKEIGDKLFISRKTVDNHIYRIFQKTAVKNRVELLNLFKI